ncbi:unnamed protein product [Urochloa decumbens]|uniref:F-box domain-containing protein n=1 Tax=Urochloa decumbens TaxID=240449 RepID=A0ABC9BTC6_9POAL
MPSRCIGSHERRRRACRHRRREAAEAFAAAEARDWADGLGTDLLLRILGRLDHVDVLMSADRVCRPRRPGRAHDVAPRRQDVLQAQPLRRSLRGHAAQRGDVQHAADDRFLIYLSEM